MNRKLILCALQQVCIDTTSYYKPQSACNYYSTSASNNSMALIKRYAKAKQRYNFGSYRFNILEDIFKPLNIYNGEKLREAIAEANTLFPNSAHQFKMISDKERRHQEMMGEVEDLIRDGLLNMVAIKDEDIMNAETKEERAKLFEGYAETDIIIRDYEGKNTYVYADTDHLLDRFSNKSHAKNLMKSAFSYQVAKQGDSEVDEEFLKLRDCTVGYYIKHGNKSLSGVKKKVAE